MMKWEALKTIPSSARTIVSTRTKSKPFQEDQKKKKKETR
jgi:hypothetical protein